MVSLLYYINRFICKDQINGFQTHVSSMHNKYITTPYCAKGPSNHSKVFYFQNYEIYSNRVLLNDFLITKTKFLWHESNYSVQLFCKTTDFCFFIQCFVGSCMFTCAASDLKLKQIKTALNSTATQKHTTVSKLSSHKTGQKDYLMWLVSS